MSARLRERLKDFLFGTERSSLRMSPLPVTARRRCAGWPAQNASTLSIELVGEALDRLLARPGDMRGQDEVRPRRERMSGWSGGRRLAVTTSNPAPAICPWSSAVDQRLLVDQPAAGGVDEQRPALHQRRTRARRSGCGSRASAASAA